MYPYDAPYIPTPIEVVRAMLRVAELRPDDVLIDLGCGDGRIVVEAARLHGVRAIGVDLDENLLACARASARTAGVEGLVSFRCGNLLEADLSEASVVMLYMLTEVNLRLRPRLVAMPAGTRIVAHRFGMGEWEPERFWMLGTAPILRWRVTGEEDLPGTKPFTTPGSADRCDCPTDHPARQHDSPFIHEEQP